MLLSGYSSVAATRLEPVVYQDSFNNPEYAVVNGEERAKVRACIEQLPLAMKTVIICRLLYEMTIAETADVMTWSPARVRVTYSRAVRKFRAIWDQYSE